MSRSNFYNFYKIKQIMIRSVISFINNATRKLNPSVTALVEGRDITNLQEKLDYYHKVQRDARIEQQAFKVQIANMGKTEAELFTLKRNWVNQTINITVQQYAEALETLEDKLEEERQQRSRKVGNL